MVETVPQWFRTEAGALMIGVEPDLEAALGGNWGYPWVHG